MHISPSIASGNLLRIEEEVAFSDRYFNSLHLDIEDGVAVSGITFGTRMCQMICDVSSAAEKTIHLEVWRPLDYLEELRRCKADMVFIQTTHLEDPEHVISKFRQAGIPTGISVSLPDLSCPSWNRLTASADCILVATAYPEDPDQRCQDRMLDLAAKLADSEKTVWIDGGVNAEIVHQLRHSSITAAVMGRAVFQDKEQAVRQFCQR